MKFWAFLAAAVCACGGSSVSSNSGSTGSDNTGDAGNAGDAGTGNTGSPAANVTIEVRLEGTGTGSVTSTPAGIACPGSCAMVVTAGTAVTLTPAAGANSNFVGFGGGCSGLSCALTASATTGAVFANFGANASGTVPPADPCAGIAVPAVTAADLKTFELTGSVDCNSNQQGSDLQGNFYVSGWQGGIGNGFTVVPSGKKLEFTNGEIFGYLASGFTAATMTNVLDPVFHYQSFSPEGDLMTSVDFPAGVESLEFDTSGRAIIATGSCDASGATTTLNISYFDDTNAIVRTATTSGPGCMVPSVALKVLTDTKGLTLVIVPSFKNQPFGGVAPGNFAARWLDASGNPLTDWFAAGALTDVGFLTQPLIGGGIAVSSDGSNWSFLPSGEARIAPSPAVLSLGVLNIVLGGKAYAVQSDTMKALIAPTGEVCAQLPPMSDATAQASLSFGRDGTVAAAQVHVAADFTTSCSFAWYPGLLK